MTKLTFSFASSVSSLSPLTAIVSLLILSCVNTRRPLKRSASSLKRWADDFVSFALCRMASASADACSAYFSWASCALRRASSAFDLAPIIAYNHYVHVMLTWNSDYRKPYKINWSITRSASSIVFSTSRICCWMSLTVCKAALAVSDDCCTWFWNPIHEYSRQISKIERCEKCSITRDTKIKSLTGQCEVGVIGFIQCSIAECDSFLCLQIDEFDLLQELFSICLISRWSA